MDLGLMNVVLKWCMRMLINLEIVISDLLFDDFFLLILCSLFRSHTCYF